MLLSTIAFAIMLACIPVIGMGIIVGFVSPFDVCGLTAPDTDVAAAALKAAVNPTLRVCCVGVRKLGNVPSVPSFPPTMGLWKYVEAGTQRIESWYPPLQKSKDGAASFVVAHRISRQQEWASPLLDIVDLVV